MSGNKKLISVHGTQNNNNLVRKLWCKGVEKVFKMRAKKHISDEILGKICFWASKKIGFGAT